MSRDDSDALLGLHRALGEIVVELVEARGIEHAGRLVADFGVRHLGADMAAVWRHLRRGGPELVAATDEVVGELVRSRARDRHLPGGRPLAEGEVLLVRSGFGSQARLPLRAGMLRLESALLVGLPQLSSGPATLELYSSRRAAFTATGSEIPRLARLTGSALRAVEQRANLEEALHTRDVIGRAQGLLMERYQLTGDQAMAYLRRHSQQSQEPIRELAARFVGQHEIATGAVRHEAEGD